MGLVFVQDFMSLRHIHDLLENSTPRSRVYSGSLACIVKSMLLAVLILSFAWSSFMMFSAARSDHFQSDVSVGNHVLPLLFRDLEKEGLVKLGDKALFVSSGGEEDEVPVSELSHIVKQNEIFVVSSADQERQSTIPSEAFDFVFAYDRHVSSPEFIDRILKVGGILAVRLNRQEPSLGFFKPYNYEIVYVRRFRYTIMAMRKMGYVENTQNSFAKRKLLGIIDEAREKALSKLEDVLLEPPRASSRNSRTYLKRTRYLPDLMGDSLDLKNYPRRVFIDVGASDKQGSVTEWFSKNYPTRNLEFEMYRIEMVSEDDNSDKNFEVDSVPQRMGMSEWLNENVKEEEYVVMMAEAEVVEEMVKSKSIKLVDELFLECKPKGLGFGGGRRRSQRTNGRAYWECLALYGKLRDEGIAVHQWWG